MPLTRDDTAARVRFNLDDAGITFFSADDINDSIQDGYDEVVAIARTITNSSAITLTNETSYYNLSSLISDYIHVVALFNDNTNRWLDYYAHVLLRELRSDWELAKGESEGFTVWDGRWISVFPRLVTAAGTITVIYKASANTLVAATVPSIPFQYERILEKYCTMDLLEQSEEWVKAGLWFKDYFTDLAELKKHMNNRILTDMIAHYRSIPARV